MFMFVVSAIEKPVERQLCEYRRLLVIATLDEQARPLFVRHGDAFPVDCGLQCSDLVVVA